ncbi:MAG: DUF3408 domain-containing protein [Prevotella sp.]|nr:DUF3408 domain-containing protein [Prevotella sp.]
MAKRYDNDFDADAFVENFRAKEAPPSAPLSNTDNSNSTTHEPPSPVQSNHNGTSASKSRNSTLTTQTEEYRRRFIDDLTYLCPPSGCSNVRICSEFVKQIRQLQLLCGNRKANLTTFINNLLRQHFDECKEAIVKLSKEYDKPLE